MIQLTFTNTLTGKQHKTEIWRGNVLSPGLVKDARKAVCACTPGECVVCKCKENTAISYSAKDAEVHVGTDTQSEEFVLVLISSNEQE